MTFILHLIVDEEPVKGLARVIEIARRRCREPGLQKLDERRATTVVDTQIGIGLHCGDEAIFGTIRFDVLYFKVEAQPIGRAQLDMGREIFGLCRVFTLETQQFGWDPANTARGLGQRTCDELIIVIDCGCARREYGEQRVVIHQRQYGEFVQRRIGRRAQIFHGDLSTAIIAFPLTNRRK